MANNNVQTFEPQNQTISEIFSGDTIYNIPNYQRQYCWNNKHLEELWSDLYESFLNKSIGNDCYFLGSIVVIDNGTAYQDLIDGQQRITTLMIMLNVLYKSFPNLNISKTGPRVVKNSKLKSYIYFDPDEDVIQLQLQSDAKYDSLFKEIIVDTNDYSIYKEPSKSQLKSSTPKYNFINTARFFYEKFNSLDEEELNDFVNYIFFNTNIIKIVCVNESFAIKLFQVLNDRGEDLKSSDIIKSYIIGKFDPNNAQDQKLKEIFNNNWKEIEDISNRYDFSVDDFMVIYEYYKLASNPKKQVTEELKDVINKSNINKIVDELSTFAKNVEKIYTKVDPKIYSLRYIPWQNYVNSILATANQVNYYAMDELLFELRRFYYLSFISGKNLNQIKNTSFNLIEAIKNRKTIDEIKVIISSCVRKYKMIRSTYEALDEDVYGESFLKPLMLSLEYEKREKNKEGIMTNTTFTIIDKHLHMDHILPKKYKESKEWLDINEEDASYNLNKIGNMALLLDIKNEEALNHGFDKKKKIYLGLEESISKGKTPFEYSQEVTLENNWTTDSIKKRTENIINDINSMLNINRDDIIEEITPDEEDILPENGKWIYKECYYTNKEIRNVLLNDYVIENEINKFSDIPSDLVNTKIHSHEAFKEFLTEHDISMNYSYIKTRIGNLELYSRDYGDYNDTVEFIQCLRKYYKFSITRTETEQDSKSNITEEMVKELYLLCKKIKQKEISHQFAVDSMVSKGMNNGSAHIYFTCFEKMICGEVFKKFPNLFTIKYFIENIYNDYGQEAGMKAIESFRLNLEYRDSIGLTITKGLHDLYRELCEKYIKSNK